jgi:hypothetical protein
MFMKWNVGNKKGGFSRNNQIGQPKLIQMGEISKETVVESLDPFFYSDNANDANAYYLPTVGVTNLKLCEPNEVIADQATIFFRILDAFKIPYALFAGSSIGLLRSGKTLPFVDDYDIIIFNKHVPLLSNAAPVLKKHGFKMVQSVHPHTKQKTNGGCTVYSSVIQRFYKNANVNGNDVNNSRVSHSRDNNSSEECENEWECTVKKSHFQCDIFFSYFDGGGFLRNNASWGLYHGKNIHVKEALPFQRRTFDGLSLPFFKNVASEVFKCYGDIERCIVESHNLNVRAIYRSWKTAHAEFERVKQCAKDNTVKAIFQNQNRHGVEEYDDDDDGQDDEGKSDDGSGVAGFGKNALNILDNAFSKNSLNVLRDIHENKTKTIYCFSMDFIIRHAACIKYYFPTTVQIEYFSYSRDSQVVMFLNYVDVLHVYNAAIRDFYNDPQITYLKKPRIDIITVFTYGAFSSDDGKDFSFSILTECAKYSENICVALSHDPPESFESRMNGVKRCCKFVKRVCKYEYDDDSAGSAEFINGCIQMSGANIIIADGKQHPDLEKNININRCCCVIRQNINVNLKNTKSVRFLQH